MPKKIMVASVLQLLFSVVFVWQASAQSEPSTVNATVVVDQKALVKAMADGSTTKKSRKNYGQLDSEDDGPDSEPSSFASEIEDTGTPGHKKVEMNLYMACDRVNSQNKSCEKAAEISFGIGEKFEISFARSHEIETVEGVQDGGNKHTDIGFKYRYWEKNGWSAAAAVGATIVGNTAKIDLEGNEIPSEGNSVTYMCSF